MYDDLVKLGLLGADDQRDAKTMALLSFAQQIGRAGAPRLDPTPPPVDLSKAMMVYQNQMKSAMARGALKKKMEKEQRQRDFFKSKAVDPIAAREIAMGRGVQQAQLESVRPEGAVNVETAKYGEELLPEDFAQYDAQRAMETAPNYLKAAEAQTTIPSHLSFLEPAKARALMGLGQEFPEIGTKAYSQLLTRKSDVLSPEREAQLIRIDRAKGPSGKMIKNVPGVGIVDFSGPTPKVLMRSVSSKTFKDPDLITLYERYKKENPGYRGNLIDFQKLMTGAKRKSKLLTEAEFQQKRKLRPEPVKINLGARYVSKEFTENYFKRREEAEDALQLLDFNRKARAYVNSGIIAGFGGDFRLNMGRALQLIGFRGKDDPVGNTQAFVALMGNQVGKIIKQFGAGTGLSDADREYAENIAAGKITLTKEAITKIMNMNDQISKFIIERTNNFTKNLKSDYLDQIPVKDPIYKIPKLKKPTANDIAEARKTVARGVEKFEVYQHLINEGFSIKGLKL